MPPEVKVLKSWNLKIAGQILLVDFVRHPTNSTETVATRPVAWKCLFAWIKLALYKQKQITISILVHICVWVYHKSITPDTHYMNVWHELNIPQLLQRQCSN